MKRREMQKMIQRAFQKTPDATLHLLDRGLRHSRGFDEKWAGDHPGRQRVVADLNEAIEKAKVKAAEYREATRRRALAKMAAEKKKRVKA